MSGPAISLGGAITQGRLESPVCTFPRSNCQTFRCENLQYSWCELSSFTQANMTGLTTDLTPDQALTDFS
ncbi:rCG25448 [Rattus norvegicus]|uniref:RCG25448 n=1 Tax=Rattus norvegicus TaxID=10116 RepID=A6I2K4_RAT|nr:rCG25448 [Rattus norvegicus]